MAKFFDKLFKKKSKEKDEKELERLKLEYAKEAIEKEIKELLNSIDTQIENKKKRDLEILQFYNEYKELKKKVSKQEESKELLKIVSENLPKSTSNRFLSKVKSLKEGLLKTRKNFISKLDRIFLGKKELDEDVIEQLEELLISSDVGVKTTFELIEKIEERVSRTKLSDINEVKSILKDYMLEILLKNHAELIIDRKPFVIMVVGVNGTGKTTTIGKLGYNFKKAGKKVIFAAADTFRAAAIDQLEEWAKRGRIDLIKQKEGADPSAVAFDAVKAAVARDADIVIIDTAGRLHTKINLMEELKKMKRVIKKVIPDAPHEILLVLDANTGQNAISQTKMFNEALDITGIILTKLDGTAKGGIVFAVTNEFGIPIRYIGVGEKIEDLREFNPKEFVDAIFE